MTSEDKLSAAIAMCFAFGLSAIAWALAWNNVEVTHALVAGGYTQVQVQVQGSQQIMWVKPGAAPKLDAPIEKR